MVWFRYIVSSGAGRGNYQLPDELINISVHLWLAPAQLHQEIDRLHLATDPDLSTNHSIILCITTPHILNIQTNLYFTSVFLIQCYFEDNCLQDSKLWLLWKLWFSRSTWLKPWTLLSWIWSVLMKLLQR